MARRLPCVKIEDVKEIAIELKFRFKLKKLELLQIESLIITEQIRKKNVISICEIKIILMKYFCLFFIFVSENLSLSQLMNKHFY